MATATSGASTRTEQEFEPQRQHPLREIREFWRQFFVAAFNPYRPEEHYMRGPGPAWRAKHGNPKRQG